MDLKDIRTLKILEKLESEKTPSQRDLSGELNISLGLVNSFVKRLVRKGFVKITTIPKKRIKYILTPRGAAEKTRLTYEYIQYSYDFYKEARQKLRNLYSDLAEQGIARIVFYGAGDLAEIAYISLQETPLNLVAIVDDEQQGKKFMKFIVADPALLSRISFDRILVTTINLRDEIFKKIVKFGISPELIIEIS